MQILISIINYGGTRNVKELRELKVRVEDMSLEEIRYKYFEMKNDKTVHWGDTFTQASFLAMMLKENGYTWDMYHDGIYKGLPEAIKGGKRSKGGGSSENESMVINSNDNRRVKNTVEETKEYRDQLKKWTEAHDVTLPTLR